jgi:hypothetical protein
MASENVYGNFQPVSLGDKLVQGFAAGQQMAESDARLSDLARQRKKAELEDAEDQRVKGLYAQHIGEDGKLNQQTYLSDLGKINPAKMMAAQEHFAKLGKMEGEAAAQAIKTKADELDSKISQASMVARLAGSVKDQASYEAALGHAKTMGLDISGLPPQYNPQMVAQLAKANMDAAKAWGAEKQQHEMKIADEQLSLQKSKQAFEKDQAIKKDEREAKKESFDTAGKLRTELAGLPTAKTMQDVSASYNRVQASAKDPSPAGDLALLFNYMKMLDPGSAVRESEFANAASAGSIPVQIRAQWEKVRSGQRLTPEQRADFVSRAGGMYGSQLDQFKKLSSDYERLAINSGANPDDVLLNMEANAPVRPTKTLARDGSGGFIKDANASSDTPPGAKLPAKQADPRDAAALNALKSMDPSSPKAFRLRSILKSKGVLE